MASADNFISTIDFKYETYSGSRNPIKNYELHKKFVEGLEESNYKKLVSLTFSIKRICGSTTKAGSGSNHYLEFSYKINDVYKYFKLFTVLKDTISNFPSSSKAAYVFFDHIPNVKIVLSASNENGQLATKNNIMYSKVYTDSYTYYNMSIYSDKESVINYMTIKEFELVNIGKIYSKKI